MEYLQKRLSFLITVRVLYVFHYLISKHAWTNLVTRCLKKICQCTELTTSITCWSENQLISFIFYHIQWVIFGEWYKKSTSCWFFIVLRISFNLCNVLYQSLDFYEGCLTRLNYWQFLVRRSRTYFLDFSFNYVSSFCSAFFTSFTT